MAKVIYSERTINETLEYCRIYGIGPAIRELKKDDKPAPSYPTIARWFKERDEELPSIDSLQAKARGMGLFYSDNEKKYVAQRSLERIAEKLDQDDLDSDDLKKLTDALNKAVVTMNLIDGKATNVTESRQKDGTDTALYEMLNEAKAKNAVKEAELS